MYPVMVGTIKDIRPVSETSERVQLRGVDDVDLLSTVSVRTPLYSTIPIDEAVGHILTDVGWTGGTNLDQASDYLRWWWADGHYIMDEIQELMDPSLGIFFIMADGTARLINRNRSHTPSITLTPADLLRGISRPQPWEVIRNVFNLTVYPRTEQATAELWRMGEVLLIPAGATTTVYGSFASGAATVPATGVISPVSTTDYLMNENATGTGASLTASLSVVATIYGSSVKLVLTNNAAVEGYVTLKIRGNPLIATPTTLVKEDAASIARYQRHEFTLGSTWLQALLDANNLSEMLIDQISHARSFPRLRIRGTPALQFAPELFDDIALNLPGDNIVGTYHLAEIEHEWTEPTGNITTSTFRFEPAFHTDSYWIFTTELGISSIFGF
jgi:hypothetical protein